MWNVCHNPHTMPDEYGDFFKVVDIAMVILPPGSIVFHTGVFCLFVL